MFWQSSPYSWPVIGWTSDLNSYTLEQARHYFDTYYQPSNLVAVIVGDFDADQVKPIIHRYFDRLEPGVLGSSTFPDVFINMWLASTHPNCLYVISKGTHPISGI